jgi:hypothetical protein
MLYLNVHVNYLVFIVGHSKHPFNVRSSAKKGITKTDGTVLEALIKEFLHPWLSLQHSFDFALPEHLDIGVLFQNAHTNSISGTDSLCSSSISTNQMIFLIVFFAGMPKNTKN